MNSSNALPLITEIKGHSLDDGPGIRTVIFFKGCPLNCLWCHNPETINPRQELSFDSSLCQDYSAKSQACEGCVASCSAKAISVKEAGISVDRNLCDSCGQCVDQCIPGALSLVGQQIPVNEIVRRILRYRAYFDNSGGGVTLSGGEATLYSDYCEKILTILKAKKIHTLLETCGFFNYDAVSQRILPFLDEVYFDIKLMNSLEHKNYCGQGNERILKNFAKLIKDAQNYDVNILPRIPLIPDVTTHRDNLAAIAGFLKENGVRKVALLKYNPLWQSKSDKVGRETKFSHKDWLKDSLWQQCKSYFKGLEIV